MLEYNYILSSFLWNRLLRMSTNCDRDRNKKYKDKFQGKMAKNNKNRRKDLPKFLKSEIAKKKKLCNF